MYISLETNVKTAWIGIDAPIPGIMTQDYEKDYYLSSQMVKDCLIQKS